MSKSLSSDKEYKNKLEEQFLKHIGYEHVENICNDMEAEKDNWNEIIIPESLDKWFVDFKKMEEKRRKRYFQGNKLVRFAKKAAVIVLFILGFNYVLITNVEAYRMQFLKSVIYIQEKFTQIDLRRDKSVGNSNIPENWSDMYYLSYLPNGYTLENSISNKLVKQLIYTNAEGHYITFQQYNSNASFQIDSEDAKVTDIIINKENAVLVEKANHTILTWIQEDRAFYLEANQLEAKEIIKMAEKIKIKKN